MSRSTGGWRRASLLAGVVLALLAAPLRAQDGLTSEEWAYLKQIVSWLQDGDTAALAEATNFERRLAEGVARGTARRGWNDLDQLGQLLEIQQTTEDWVSDDPRFLRGANVYHARPIDDPDAGQGPVPDRRLFLLILKGVSSGQLRELLVTLTGELELLDLTFGEPFHGQLDPQAEPSILPEPLPRLQDAEVTWPDEVDEAERSEALGLVDELVAVERRRQEQRLVEFLHRNPRAGVTALVERLIVLDREREPDAELEDRLVRALEMITGRSSDFSPVPRWGQDESVWRASNRAQIASWARWHGRHGARFAAVPVADPVEPTFAERAGRSDGAHLARVSEPEVEETSPGRGPTRPSAPRPDGPGAAAGGSPGAVPEPTGGPPSKPRVVLRDIERAPDVVEPEVSADELEILWGDKRRRVIDIGDDMPASIRRELDKWAAVIVQFGMTVVVSGNPDHVVFGLADDDVLVAAAHSLDAAWEVVDPIVPVVTGRRPRATIALLFDRRGREPDTWRPLIDTLVERKVITADAGKALRGDPGGVTARHHPLFLQPVWDMAGNAAAGDDEFRLTNELSHKLTQCLLTQRCGNVPASVRWALGHVVENRLHGNVYQFNSSGFVSSGDHFDWPVRARQVLEKRSKRRGFSLAERFLAGDQMEDSLDNALIAWGVVETLASDQPELLSTMLQDLADIHGVNDPYGRSSKYRGDAADTLEAVEHRLSGLKVADIVSHLRGL